MHLHRKLVDSLCPIRTNGLVLTTRCTYKLHNFSQRGSIEFWWEASENTYVISAGCFHGTRGKFLRALRRRRKQYGSSYERQFRAYLALITVLDHLYQLDCPLPR